MSLTFLSWHFRRQITRQNERQIGIKLAFWSVIEHMQKWIFIFCSLIFRHADIYPPHYQW